MQKKYIGPMVVALVVLVGLSCVGYDIIKGQDKSLRLYGSVDLRTVNLAPDSAGRLMALPFEEGMHVEAGQVIAQVDSAAYAIAERRAYAQWQVAQHQLDLMLAGFRLEDIAAAQASLEAAKKDTQFKQQNCQRQERLGTATTQELRENACTAWRVAQANQEVAQKQLDLLQAGNRPEEIAIARSQAELAKQAWQETKLALDRCQLVSPSDGVIRSRLKEPGDMVGSSVPVYEMALMDPLWVRVWVDEVNLHRIQMGQKVKIHVDSYPDAEFEGTVGFISTVAEFTPRTVQTEALRTSLVYEVRITVVDPTKRLRLGMPATVVLGS